MKTTYYRQFGKLGIAALLLASSQSYAAIGSAVGEVIVDGQVNIQRDGSTSSASSSDVLFNGDTVMTQGEGSSARVELLEGGNASLFGDSSVQFNDGQVVFGGSGGGCLENLSAPVSITVNGAQVASGVTSGGVVDGVFYATCEGALAALSGAGEGLPTWAKAVMGVTGIAIGAEIIDDDPTHGS